MFVDGSSLLQVYGGLLEELKDLPHGRELKDLPRGREAKDHLSCGRKKVKYGRLYYDLHRRAQMTHARKTHVQVNVMKSGEMNARGDAEICKVRRYRTRICPWRSKFLTYLLR